MEFLGGFGVSVDRLIMTDCDRMLRIWQMQLVKRCTFTKGLEIIL